MYATQSVSLTKTTSKTLTKKFLAFRGYHMSPCDAYVRHLNLFMQLYVLDMYITVSCAIGHFQKYHNTLCLSSKILHKHCFHFLLGLTLVPRENENNAYANFCRTNKEYYGIFESGLLRLVQTFGCVQWFDDIVTLYLHHEGLRSLTRTYTGKEHVLIHFLIICTLLRL